MPNIDLNWLFRPHRQYAMTTLSFFSPIFIFIPRPDGHPPMTMLINGEISPPRCFIIIASGDCHASAAIVVLSCVRVILDLPTKLGSTSLISKWLYKYNGACGCCALIPLHSLSLRSPSWALSNRFLDLLALVDPLFYLLTVVVFSECWCIPAALLHGQCTAFIHGHQPLIIFRT